MITLTKLNGKSFVINADLIETLESTPDTVVTLTTGKKYIVMEKTDDIIDKVIQYRKEIFCSGLQILKGSAAKATQNRLFNLNWSL